MTRTKAEISRIVSDLRAHYVVTRRDDMISPPKVRDAIPRLIHASANRFGMCIENLVNAIEEALNDGSDRLALSHFSRSWAATAAVDFRENPFVNSEWRSIAVTGRMPATGFGKFKK